MKDVTEFVAAAGPDPDMGRVEATVTYQDSCHLAHGRRIRSAPRQILRAIPGLVFREMPLSDLCCGSAGIYNVAHPEMASSILDREMPLARGTGADIIATANPGACCNFVRVLRGTERGGA